MGLTSEQWRHILRADRCGRAVTIFSKEFQASERGSLRWVSSPALRTARKQLGDIAPASQSTETDKYGVRPRLYYYLIVVLTGCTYG